MSSAKRRMAVQQGSLDGLCGIYSIVNSIGLIEPKGMDHEERVALFIYLTNLLDDGRGIGEIIHNGTGFRKLGELIDVASQRWTSKNDTENPSKNKKTISRRTAMKRRPDDFDEFWSVLKEHVDLDEGRTAILGLTGTHNHWSVVQKVTPNRIDLFDSNGLQHLDKRRCGLAVGGEIKHKLWSTQTFLLSAQDWEEPEE
ncbi:hypothetical protein IMCC20628_03576 [Hoeflea sp. IMCC20628]|uniref:hypothetical protein n=1 Tax=Hoeflea sp. IMCC20628 TaxID=1620421 RepID=UPI00063AF489|nr:hypothetical protein [Hoeflea sp. IMCC20628]AKI02263.1 hypothetical protein IMCC20628_03576 [Hoeflea sp. IMCC20628]